MTFHSFSPTAGRFLGCLLLVTLASCGDSGPPRYELSGTITYKGKGVPAGSIRFEPMDMAVNNASVGDADIKDGKFSTLLERGITGGMHRIYVDGYNGIPEPGSGPNGASVFESYVFEQELASETSTIDIVVPDTVKAMRAF